MRWKPHVRFGGRARETYQPRGWHRALVRPHLANDALTRCRHRVQQETLEHRGWKGDPLYDVPKLLLLGTERVDDAGWVRIHAALDAGDPNGEVGDTWVAKERVRDIFATDDPEQAAVRLDAAIAWCSEAESGP